MTKNIKSKPGTSQQTKKQISRRRREEKQLRWVWAITGSVAALIVIILVAGFVLQNTQVVAIVNGVKIRLPDYQSRVKFQYYYLISEGFIESGAISQIDESQRASFYESIIDEMIDEVLVRQEAQKLGLTVNEQEIQTEIQETWFQHYSVPPTPTPTPTADPEATPTVEGTPLPTATPDTEEAFQTRYKEFQQNVLKRSGMSEKDFHRMIETSLLRDKLQEVQIADVPTEEDQVWLRYVAAQDETDAQTKIAAFVAGSEDQVHARHILVATQAEAEAIFGRLNAGEDLAALAAELSMDTSNKDQGGDLGWFGRGEMVAAFEEAAFTGEIGLYPFPVETEFGFHIIEILGHELRPINRDEEMYDMGWNNRNGLADQFGALFAEMAFGAEIGLLQQPIPTEYGIAVIEVLGHQVRQLTEADQDQRRAELFQTKLDEIRENADIQDRWSVDMAPRQM
ncbi:MAG: peptidylprolyl isomerase [Anaerolineae bacterium]|nr:peptidylprolyl isomerase [Anaerolineae bacterium]